MNTTSRGVRTGALETGSLPAAPETTDDRGVPRQGLDERSSLALHDLRSSPTVINGHAALLRRRLVGADTVAERTLDSLRSIEAAATRMGVLLEEVLGPQGPDGRPPRLSGRRQVDEVDLVDLVRRMAVESEPQAGGPDRIVVVAGGRRSRGAGIGRAWSARWPTCSAMP